MVYFAIAVAGMCGMNAETSGWSVRRQETGSVRCAVVSIVPIRIEAGAVECSPVVEVES